MGTLALNKTMNDVATEISLLQNSDDVIVLRNYYEFLGIYDAQIGSMFLDRMLEIIEQDPQLKEVLENGIHVHPRMNHVQHL